MPSVGDFSKWVPALTVCKSCTVKLTGISFFTGGANAAAFSDIKIVYGKISERSIRLHRIILCNDNAYFMNAIGPDSEWAVSTTLTPNSQYDVLTKFRRPARPKLRSTTTTPMR